MNQNAKLLSAPHLHGAQHGGNPFLAILRQV
jgi:hypothetical protein